MLVQGYMPRALVEEFYVGSMGSLSQLTAMSDINFLVGWYIHVTVMPCDRLHDLGAEWENLLWRSRRVDVTYCEDVQGQMIWIVDADMIQRFRMGKMVHIPPFLHL